MNNKALLINACLGTIRGQTHCVKSIVCHTVQSKLGIPLICVQNHDFSRNKSKVNMIVIKALFNKNKNNNNKVVLKTDPLRFSRLISKYCNSCNRKRTHRKSLLMHYRKNVDKSSYFGKRKNFGLFGWKGHSLAAAKIQIFLSLFSYQ